MDKTNLAILRELTQGGVDLAVLPVEERRSVSALSRRLGISDGTVRRRLVQLRESGFLRGFRTIPHPDLLGLEMGAFGLLLSPQLPKELVVDQVAAVEGVFVVQEHYGPQLGICLFSHGGQDLARKANLFRRVAVDGSLVYTRMLLPDPAVDPSLRDWRLISHLLEHGPQPYGKLSHELGLSIRTVMRRLALLARSNGIFSIVEFDFGAIRGGAPADLILTFGDGRRREEAERCLMKLVDDYLFYAGRWESLSVYALVVPNSLTATSLERAASLVPGVESARVEFVNRHIEPPGALTDYLGQAIRSHTGISPSPPLASQDWSPAVGVVPYTPSRGVQVGRGSPLRLRRPSTAGDPPA